MASCFILTLDTTAPVLTINCPAWTTQFAATPISIQANENLGTIQSVRIIDAAGKVWPLILEHDSPKSLYTTWDFGSCVNGWARIEATVGDEVDNLSTIAKDIQVIDGAKIYVRNFKVQMRKMEMAVGQRAIKTMVIVRALNMSAFVRKVEVRVFK